MTATRRGLVALVSGGLARCAAAETPQPMPLTGAGLRVRAAAKGIGFGAALKTSQLAEADLVAAFQAECSLVVAEYQMKWAAIEPQAGTRRYGDGDQLLRFARAHGMGMRGHTLVWHESQPGWVESLDARATASAMARHIDQTLLHWRGAIESWDVVNEAVAPEDGRPDWLRRTPLLRKLGPDHLPQAFHIAHAADPAARLVYNDFGCEHATPYARRKRLGVLNLLTSLKRAGVPLHGLGMQAHLQAGQPFDAKEWRAFLAEVAGLGLTIEVTELDVNDRALAAATGLRDTAGAELVRRFLDASLAEPAVRTVVCWGLSDRHSWVRQGRLPEHQRSDGVLARPLPFDDAMRRKPIWGAIAAALDATPPRG